MVIRNKIRLFFISLFLVLSFFVYFNVQAAYDFINQSGVSDVAGASGHLDQPLFGKTGSIEGGISTILNTVLSFLGVIFLILIIYGGVTWMTARGNEKNVEKAKMTITRALIGLIIVVAAYAISYYLVAAFTGQTMF